MSGSIGPKGWIALALWALAAPGWGQAPATTLVTMGFDGKAAGAGARHPALSGDGRYMAFETPSLNLLHDFTPADMDNVLVEDLNALSYEWGSLGSGGVHANWLCTDASISSSGRRVAFNSYADNLTPGDTNQDLDVFLRDLDAATTTRVSVAPGGGAANGPSALPSLSADGRWVAFASLASNLVAGDTNSTADIFLYDTLKQTTALVSAGLGGVPANDYSNFCTVSRDGHYVAFASRATNLVAGGSAASLNVFVRDTWGKSTERISRGPAGQDPDGFCYAPRISASGRYVAYFSYATNLVPGATGTARKVLLYDRARKTTVCVSVNSQGALANADVEEPDLQISADGRFVAFVTRATNLAATEATPSLPDVFLHDIGTDQTTLVSIGPDGKASPYGGAEPALSGDGLWVAFADAAKSPTDQPPGIQIYRRGPLPIAALPMPSITTLAPASIRRGTPGLTVTVKGSGYVRSCVVRFNGVDRPTTYVSPTELKVALTAADLATAGPKSITVLNPAGAGATSLPATFTVLGLLFGDADKSGTLTGADAGQVLRVAAGLLSTTDIAGMDVAPPSAAAPSGYGDGRVNMLDAVRIVRLVFGK